VCAAASRRPELFGAVVAKVRVKVKARAGSGLGQG
jgi:hypothetical protein